MGFSRLEKKQVALFKLGLFVLISFIAGWMTNDALRSDALVFEAFESVSGSSYQGHRNAEMIHYDEQDIMVNSTATPISKDRLQNFSTSLSKANYRLALAQYQEIANNDDVEFAEARSRLFNHLQQLLKNASSQRFVDLTDEYLSIFYDDVDVLLYLAAFNYSLGDMVEAAAVYRLVNSYAYSAEQIAKLRQSVDIFISKLDLHYAASGDLFGLTTIYSQLDSDGLLQSRHQLAFAKVYLSQGNTSGAIALLKRLKDQSEVASSARALLTEVELKEGDEIVPVERFYSDQIALKPRGNQFSLDLDIDGSMVDLLIDTGASMTTMSQQQFQRSFNRDDLTFVEQRLFNTANGIAKGSVYRVDSVQLGRFILNDVHIAVLDFDLAGQLDGLLGMNVLGQFHFQIDQNNARLLLSERH